MAFWDILSVRRNYSDSYFLQNWAEFVFELSFISLKISTHDLQN